LIVTTLMFGAEVSPKIFFAMLTSFEMEGLTGSPAVNDITTHLA